MSNLIKTKFNLSGLSCSACEKLITKRVLTLPGVQNVVVNLSNQEVEIEGNREINFTELSEILSDTDYKVISKKLT